MIVQKILHSGCFGIFGHSCCREFELLRDGFVGPLETAATYRGLRLPAAEAILDKPSVFDDQHGHPSYLGYLNLIVDEHSRRF